MDYGALELNYSINLLLFAFLHYTILYHPYHVIPCRVTPCFVQIMNISLLLTKLHFSIN
jgi:hypothetical protein